MSSGGSENQPNLQIMAQYIKDLSFENPGAPQGFTTNPQMEFGVDLQARAVSPEFHEVVLIMRVNAKSEDKAVFVLELAYAALVRMVNIPEEAAQTILLIQTPTLLFPFARRIVADMVRDGGMPPLVIEPIDFVALYQSKMDKAPTPPTPVAGNA